MSAVGLTAYSVGVTVGERVRALREEKGWSKVELARRAHLNSQTIFRIEHGLIQAGWESRKKLSKAFGISIAALAAEDSADEETPSPFTALASLSDKVLLDGVFRIVRELENRGLRPDPPTPPAPGAKPPPRPRRHR